MIRLPRITYARLPEGQRWIFQKDGDDEQAIIVINEALDERRRRAARREALARYFRETQPAFLPIVLVLAVLDWLRMGARHPLGAATMGSALTVAGLALLTGDPPRIAAPPPPVITVTPSPPPATSPTAASTTSAPPGWERSTRRPGPADTVRAVRPTRTRPPHTPAPRTRTARPTPRASAAEREPTIAAINGPATPPPGPADTAPPGPETTSAPSPDDPGPVPEGPEIVDEQAAAGPVCDGLVHVDVGLDPLLGIDACLLG
ncbi:hypothetical protein [Nonomuraea sp. NPDC023979]|uniref:hypothetical protein n=1 Tax=Nonomuraea sp. NPDC023979 TaxID=3154796 RepID=UPI0033EFEF42